MAGEIIAGSAIVNIALNDRHLQEDYATHKAVSNALWHRVRRSSFIMSAALLRPAEKSRFSIREQIIQRDFRLNIVPGGIVFDTVDGYQRQMHRRAGGVLSAIGLPLVE